MKRTVLCLLGAAIICGLATQVWAQGKERRISVEEYRDKMKGGWIGQMVGVGWGAPTEFKYKGQIIPEEKVPTWRPAMVNQYKQDDIYVEMTFLRTLAQYGWDVSIRQAGIDFANSGYGLAHANRYGRANLRKGIAPPDSGHPKFNAHADDIDYQIEADFSGLIAPGMPNVGITLGETFGRLMNYGDGLYGGQFVAGMYAAAFFEKDPKKLVEAGLACIPAGSQYAEAVRDVLRWHAEAPNDWQATWKRIDAKYQLNKDYRRFSCNRHQKNMKFNIDAKINGAYIVMGLLYGKRDIEKTTVISMRCGQDSDCNPSSAAGILCTTLGMKNLPPRFTSALDRSIKFSHTAYDFDALLEVCEKLARQAIVKQGGRIEKDAAGKETFVIPVLPVKPSALEQCWEPGPAVNSRFTEEEMSRINFSPGPPKQKPGQKKKKEKKKEGQSRGKADISADVAKFAPGWTVTGCGSDMEPGLRVEALGRKHVLVTHPMSESVPCVLKKKVAVPAGKKARLVLDVGHHPNGDWALVVKAGGKVLARKKIGKNTCKNGWTTATVDLSPMAGQTVSIELVNSADGWSWEAGYWAGIAIENDEPARGPRERKTSIPPTHANVAYRDAHEQNVLDIWLAESDKPTPLAIYIHGGGFRAGSKNRIRSQSVKKFLDAGISVASVEYRFVQHQKIPTAHHDCRRALQFLRSKAVEWNLNKKRIAAWGGSAGAQLSMYLAFHDEMAEPESEDRVARESTRLRCVATSGGQATMDLDVWMKWVPGYDAHHRGFTEYFGELGAAARAAVIADVSAIDLLSKGDPPLYMSYEMRPGDPIPEGSKAVGWKHHHVIFGEKLEEKMDGLGIESHLVYPGKRSEEFASFEDFFIAKLTK